VQNHDERVHELLWLLEFLAANNNVDLLDTAFGWVGSEMLPHSLLIKTK